MSMNILWYFFDDIWRLPFSLWLLMWDIWNYYPAQNKKKVFSRKNFLSLTVLARVHQVCMQECIKCVCKIMISHTKSFWWKEMLEKFTQLDVLLFPSLWSVGANILMMNFPNFACVSACWCKYVCEGMGTW